MTGHEPSDLDAGNETVLVRVTDEDGLVGVGESDAPARVVRELVEAALRMRNRRSAMAELAAWFHRQSIPSASTGERASLWRAGPGASEGAGSSARLRSGGDGVLGRRGLGF